MFARLPANCLTLPNPSNMGSPVALLHSFMAARPDSRLYAVMHRFQEALLDLYVDELFTARGDAERDFFLDQALEDERYYHYLQIMNRELADIASVLDGPKCGPPPASLSKAPRSRVTEAMRRLSAITAIWFEIPSAENLDSLRRDTRDFHIARRSPVMELLAAGLPIDISSRIYEGLRAGACVNAAFAAGQRKFGFSRRAARWVCDTWIEGHDQYLQLLDTVSDLHVPADLVPPDKRLNPSEIERAHREWQAKLDAAAAEVARTGEPVLLNGPLIDAYY